MNLKLLSPNLIILLEEILKNQNICKLLTYNSENPFIEPNITNTSDLMFNKIFPFPFGLTTNTEEGVQLRVYYYNTILKHGEVIEDTKIFFDIVYSKTQKTILINDGTPKIRPLEIASELVSFLGNRAIDTAGKIHFEGIQQNMHVNEKFDCLRVIGNMMTIGR